MHGLGLDANVLRDRKECASFIEWLLLRQPPKKNPADDPSQEAYWRPDPAKAVGIPEKEVQWPSQM